MVIQMKQQIYIGIIESISFKEDDREFKFSNFEFEYNEKSNKIQYRLKVSFKDIPKGFFTAELNLDVGDERFIREIWCASKVGQFVAKEHNASLIIKNNRLKIKKDQI